LRRVLNRGGLLTPSSAIYTGRISPAQAKRVDEMQAVADALSLMANIVMAWNTSPMQAVWIAGRTAAVIPPNRSGRLRPPGLERASTCGVCFRFPVDPLC
jgi:hypothetical protein